jgi:DNA repair exonuclease SbcCD ATPase subunit
MTDSYLQMMIESLVMKRDILQQISELNISQANMAMMDNSSFNDSEFYSNIEQKGELIDKLLELDKGFDALFERVKASIGDNKQAYSEQIKQLQGLIKEITALSVKVQAQESRNKVIVGRKFNRMKADIQNAKKSTKTASAYYKVQRNIDYAPQFMDKKK